MTPALVSPSLSAHAMSYSDYKAPLHIDYEHLSYRHQTSRRTRTPPATVSASRLVNGHAVYNRIMERFDKNNRTLQNGHFSERNCRSVSPESSQPPGATDDAKPCAQNLNLAASVATKPSDDQQTVSEDKAQEPSTSGQQDPPDSVIMTPPLMVPPQLEPELPGDASGSSSRIPTRVKSSFSATASTGQLDLETRLSKLIQNIRSTQCCQVLAHCSKQLEQCIKSCSDIPTPPSSAQHVPLRVAARAVLQDAGLRARVESALSELPVDHAPSSNRVESSSELVSGPVQLASTFSAAEWESILRRIDLSKFVDVTFPLSDTASRQENKRAAADTATTQEPSSSGLPRAGTPMGDTVSAAESAMGEAVCELADHFAYQCEQSRCLCGDARATESSSGGESADDAELAEKAAIYAKVPGSKKGKLHSKGPAPSVDARPSWKWWSWRSRSLGRLSWLQAQITDLDGRIRQYQQLHTFLSKNKPDAHSSSTADDSCARVRPFIRTADSSRRFARTDVITRKRKFAQANSLRCDCVPPFGACVLCVGTDSSRPIPDVCASSSERMQCIDSGFHATLSQKAGTNLDKFLQSAMEEDSSEFAPSRKRKSVAVGQVLVATSSHPSIPSELASSGSISSCATASEEQGPSPAKKAALLASSSVPNFGQPLAIAGGEPEASLLLPPGSYVSPKEGPSPQQPLFNGQPEGSTGGLSMLGGRRHTTALTSSSSAAAFDIDNIIIDPSVLAGTKIEKLVYREIDTPGWRIVDPFAGTAQFELDNRTIEECTKDSAYIERHSGFEASEVRRFMAYKEWVRSQSQQRRRQSEAGIGMATSDFSGTLGMSFHHVPPPVHALEPGAGDIEVLPYVKRSFPLSDKEATSLRSSASASTASAIFSLTG